jgi:hypothetical protein
MGDAPLPGWCDRLLSRTNDRAVRSATNAELHPRSIGLKRCGLSSVEPASIDAKSRYGRRYDEVIQGFIVVESFSDDVAEKVEVKPEA